METDHTDTTMPWQALGGIVQGIVGRLVQQHRECARFGGQQLGETGETHLGGPREDGAADQLGDLRDDGVAEGSSSVHPAGNPIIHSPSSSGTFLRPSLSLTQSVMVMPEANDRFGVVPFLACFASPATRVGNNPDSVARLGKPDDGSRHAIPFRVIPRRGQRPEYTAHSTMEKRDDVLHDDVVGSKLENEAIELTPQARAFAIKPGAISRTADVLAGEAAADDINGNSICRQSFGRERSHVIVDRHPRPMLGEHAARIGLDLAERDRREAARPLQAEAEAADTAEQVEDAQHLTAPHITQPLHPPQPRPRAPVAQRRQRDAEARGDREQLLAPARLDGGGHRGGGVAGLAARARGCG